MDSQRVKERVVLYRKLAKTVITEVASEDESPEGSYVAALMIAALDNAVPETGGEHGEKKP